MRFLHVGKTLVGQLDIIQFSSTNDRSSDLLRTPGKRDLAHLDALLTLKADSRMALIVRSPVDDRLASIARLIVTNPTGDAFNRLLHTLDCDLRISPCSGCALAPGTGEHASGERTPRTPTNPRCYVARSVDGLHSGNHP